AGRQVDRSCDVLAPAAHDANRDVPREERQGRSELHTGAGPRADLAAGRTDGVGRLVAFAETHGDDTTRHEREVVGATRPPVVKVRARVADGEDEPGR